MINVALGKAQTHYGTELGITCEFQQYLLVYVFCSFLLSNKHNHCSSLPTSFLSALYWPTTEQKSPKLAAQT